MGKYLDSFRKTQLGQLLRKSEALKNIYNKVIMSKNQNRIKSSFAKNGRTVIYNMTEILNKSDYMYFAAFGTLLGYVRDGKTMDYDLDFDFGVVANEEFQPSEFILFMKQNGFKLDHWFEHEGIIREMTFYSEIDKNIHIDFFVFEIADNAYHKYGYSRENTDYIPYMETLPYFSECRIIDVEGVHIPIPENAEELLAATYTENWRNPDPNWDCSMKPNRSRVENTVGYRKYPQK